MNSALQTEDMHSSSLPSAPAALSVAGSDSGGGAGIQADLAAFRYFGVFGTTVITAVTAQNPKAVSAVEAISPDTVTAQLHAVLSEIDVTAAKTGMLFSAETIAAVASVFRRYPEIPLVVDPVMVATSGAKLLEDGAIRALTHSLLPLAAIITPNLPEARIVTGRALTDVSEIQRAARELARRYDAVVMIKGGHSAQNPGCDVVSDSDTVWELSSDGIQAQTTHGTGCSLSAAVTAAMACGDEPLTALQRGKAYVYGALRNCVQVGPSVWAMQPPPTLPQDAVCCRVL